MKLRADGFDVWVFRRRDRDLEYLLLRASAAKARRWFGGAQFWQVPSDFTGDDSVEDAIGRELARFGLTPFAIWAAEHAYTFYNRRYRDVVHISVFAAEVAADQQVTLDDGHDEHAWLCAAAAQTRVGFRGLRDGLAAVVEYVTERDPPLAELRLA
ncbi:MAG: hypothetical protein M4D80_23430 [Myxococcota bacterium]|nr:hypothetical protein [Deltaproteobacteria bacterium]MDQ3338128.1 hypothetical protein [Myxococcota bacterium]